ncbi:hypothetical protein [Photobacterium rosenbergii]|uniref:Uncharacterized protein n=1 Tax=Photobacterium rosenbergii TaxID=294936 RepID=A0ABU3ZF94_9GAMM|nr:hypothetical protein [Photobacterium rosenbergii]MDV5168765.1 hypothetical protein [Photobacterium rosenbergii]
MKTLIISLFSLFSLCCYSQSISELLVENMQKNRDNYTCHVSELVSSEFKELAVCVEGTNIWAVEIINMWVTYFSTDKESREDSVTFRERGRRLIEGATYVYSVKMVDQEKTASEPEYMSIICSNCEGLDSGSKLDDTSSYLFAALSRLSTK